MAARPTAALWQLMGCCLRGQAVPPRCKARSLLRDRRGALLAQHLVLVVLFALPVAAATAYLGYPLLRHFRQAQLSLVAPFP